MKRNMAKMAVISMLLAPAAAEESNYKMRIHKNFVKETLDKNFPVILKHIEKDIERKAELEDGTVINDMKLNIMPKNKQKWDKLETDLFFDQGQIVMELNGLEFQGSGSLAAKDDKEGRRDKDKKGKGGKGALNKAKNSLKKDKVYFSSSLDLAQLVLSLDQEVSDEGFLYPKIDITEVAF